MKGNSQLFARQGGILPNKAGLSAANPIQAPGKGTNANAYDLKNHVTPHSIPMHHIPNSTIVQRDDQGNVVRIRHYDENGNAYKDVDYTDHGRPDTHKVPHTHIIEIGNKIDRKKGARPHAY